MFSFTVIGIGFTVGSSTTIGSSEASCSSNFLNSFFTSFVFLSITSSCVLPSSNLNCTSSLSNILSKSNTSCFNTSISASRVLFLSATRCWNFVSFLPAIFLSAMPDKIPSSLDALIVLLSNALTSSLLGLAIASGIGDTSISSSNKENSSGNNITFCSAKIIILYAFFTLASASSNLPSLLNALASSLTAKALSFTPEKFTQEFCPLVSVVIALLASGEYILE